MENPFAKFVQNVNPFAKFAQPKDEGPKPIATTQDGGQIFQMADGSLSFKSPGYATTNQDAIKRIMEGATPISEAQRTTDELTIAQNPVAARVQEFNQGAPLVGEWLDEAVGMVSPRAAKAMRQTSDAMERQNPGQSAALNIAGGIAYTIPALVAGAGTGAANWVAQAPTRMGQAIRGFAAAAPAGAVETGATFAGRAEDGKRLQQGGVGAVVGAGIAGVLGVFAPALGEGVASLARRIKKLDVTTIANEFGLSPEAARVVRKYLMSDDLDAAQRVLARGGDDAMLANAGPATRQALDTAASTGGEALTIARTRVGEAVDAGSKRLLGAIDDVLGTADGGLKGATRQIAQRTAGIRQQAYDRAYNAAIDYADDAGRNIEAVLGRIPTRTIRAAISEANDAMRAAGVRNKQIMAEIADDGAVVFREMPNVQQLDELKKALQSIARNETDAVTGKVTSAGVRAQNLARDLADALAEAVPQYRTAVKLGGDKIAEENALNLGRRLLSEATTVEDVRMLAREGMSDEAKAALRRGIRENLDAIMGRARATIADLESGAVDFTTGQNASAEAVAAIRNLLTRNNMTKTRLALGTDAKRLFDELEKMADVLVLRSAVARGSQTAIRQAGQQQMADETAPGLVRRVAGNLGNPLEAAREVSQSAVGIDARSISDQQAKYYAEIADALTRIRGPEAQRALQAVREAMAGQPMKDADAQLIGRLVSGGATASAYQGLQQYPMPR